MSEVTLYKGDLLRPRSEEVHYPRSLSFGSSIGNRRKFRCNKIRSREISVGVRAVFRSDSQTKMRFTPVRVVP